MWAWKLSSVELQREGMPDKFYRRLYFLAATNKHSYLSTISNPTAITLSPKGEQLVRLIFGWQRAILKGSQWALFSYYLNMYKKQQASRQNPKNRQPALDEDSQPFLRVIHKKIRNLNKRLAEIAELQHKDNLKPEQVEKVQRKQHLLEEKQKLEDDIALLKQAHAENIELFRNHQLKQLELLARSLAVYMTHPHFPEHSKLVKLWSGLQNIQGNNLNEAITHIASVLKQSANDYKLQRALASLVAEHGEKPAQKKIPTTFTHTDEIIIVKENVLNENGRVDEIEIVEKIHDGKVSEVIILINDQIKPEDTQSPPPTPVSTEPQTQPTNQQTQQNTSKEAPKQPENAPQTTEQRLSQSRKGNRPTYKGELRQRKEHRGQKRGDGRRRYNGGDRGTEKKTYRPKQQREENKGAGEQQQESASKQQEEQMRKFKKDQIKQLENEGFIVVGKPKPKPQEQRKKNYHNEPRVQN